MLARALWLQGFAERARGEAEASILELSDAYHQLAVCRMLSFGICRVATMTGDLVAADQAIRRLTEVAASLNAPFWQNAGLFLKGKLLVEQRDFVAGLAALREAFDTCRQTGWRFSEPEFKSALAEALAGLGRTDEALEVIDDAVADADQTDGQA
jgi:tetratricopeptide (TPR) repeat protein